LYTIGNHALAGVATGVNYNGTNCGNSFVQPDEEGVIYGTDYPRQWLNVYKAPGAGPHPVVFYAHNNGDTVSACNVTNHMADYILDSGYTIVSWESHRVLSTTDDTEDSWADADIAVQYLRNNAAAFNIDMSNIIVSGRSRGTGASWKFAHSGDNAVKGIYMPQALPDPFWGFPTIWNPADDITVNSKPIHMSYKPSSPDISGDIHDPRRGLDIVDVYTSLGIGDIASVEMGLSDDNLFAYFSTFAASLDTTSPVRFSDDYSDGVLDPSYTNIGGGDWQGRNWGVLDNLDSSISTYLVNGDTNASDYTVSVKMKTRNQRTSGTNWEVARLVARMTNENNYYEAFIKLNGQLVVKKIKNGASTVLLSTDIGVDPLQWNTLSMYLKGSRIEVSVNDASIAVITNNAHSEGKAGVRSTYCECRFDDFSIMP